MEALGSGPRPSGTIARDLGFSRPTILDGLNRLKLSGLCDFNGRGRATTWFRTVDFTAQWSIVGTDEDEVWRQIRESQPAMFEGESAGAKESLHFGITEMVNNSLDHSQGVQVRVSLTRIGDDLTVEVADDGLGAFESVRDHFELASERDAIAHLAKGKQTTAESRHSGQGIFFTSKIFDKFVLRSHDLVWIVDTLREDQTIKTGATVSGTSVTMTISLETERRTKSVFDKFTDPDSLAFNRSALHVQLSQYGGTFVSRSEAKRIASQLQLFGEVVLDFKNVEAVGQGFVDELFRVWVNTNPGTRLIPINTNEDVEFMIVRGLN